MLIRNIITQGVADETTVADALRDALAHKQWDTMDVAVAYATQSGLNSLLAVIGDWPAQSRWVVGLDDGITQPAAIDTLLAVPGADLHLARLTPARRFHPKVYTFWSTNDPLACISLIGSANMTQHGFGLNGEAAVILEAETADEVTRLKSTWDKLATLGKPAGAVDLVAYAEFYQRAQTVRRRLSAKNLLPSNPDADEQIPQAPVFDGNPANATVAWIEAATPSAGGRDLEFPRPMMPFFRLAASPAHKRIRMPNGQVFVLTFTMRDDNMMWRLLFSRDSINAAIGRGSLRPVAGGNRSDLALIFRRSNNQADFEVDMIVIGSPQHQTLLAHTANHGTLLRTNGAGGRHYGYY